MKPIQTYSVVPKLPKNLKPLWDLAFNFWFSWNDNVEALFSRIDARRWRESDGNPVAFINAMSQQELTDLSNDQLFLDRLGETHAELVGYLGKTVSAVEFKAREDGQPVVAYFSFEFGIAPALPIYSGGLGILAGDHLKSASDLNLPLVGVGLCYQQGYFRQYLTPDAWQNERYPVYDFEQMPLTLVSDEQGHPVRFGVEFQGQDVQVQLWKAAVGRVALYLMDTNIAENPSEFRQLTTRLYGGDLEMRLKQEILLGIGGVKALAALGLLPRSST
jgi:starch phosphorylase